jgi:signal peptidase II
LRYIKAYGYLLTLAGIVIILDQWTKFLVRSKLDFGQQWSPWQWLAPYARIVYWHNRGAAFGIFQNGADLLTILAIVVAIAILYYFPQVSPKDWPLRLAMGLQFGGAIGNLIDRLTQGYVTDFVSLGTFPVFNVADASISIGVAILILGAWYRERQQKASQASLEVEPKRPVPESIPNPQAEEHRDE